MTCELCENSTRLGWWGVNGVTHCPGCHLTWKAKQEGHCAACHEHFASPSSFEAHLTSRGCQDPATAKLTQGPHEGALALVKGVAGTWTIRRHQTAS